MTSSTGLSRKPFTIRLWKFENEGAELGTREVNLIADDGPNGARCTVAVKQIQITDRKKARIFGSVY